ncbi:MAG TPA: NAD(P)-dependent oxidoreductase [Puia sp.]|jgi:alanine dehydrogenase|nr:NAD(P)-dependent oxidoreductase [Puia sp.]
MIRIGLIRETKIPADNRVALIPSQCKWLQKNFPLLKIFVQPSKDRCYTEKEYEMAGVVIMEDLSDCDFLFGIKEIQEDKLIPGKKYLLFSHTKKMQPFNRSLFRAILDKKITLIDYECMEHEDGQRILGFGFFAGIVGAHNGMMAYGIRTNQYILPRVYKQPSFRQLIHGYFGIKLPNLKVVVTGSGRVAHGLLEVMNLLGIIEIEPDEYLSRNFSYPVFTQLKGPLLYRNKKDRTYHREEFHGNPGTYECLFKPYTENSDLLLNGIYWDPRMPRLFEWEDLLSPRFRIQTIADITDDIDGSIPCNLGDGSMENPVYGVNKKTQERTKAYLDGSVDIMAVGNLPNELPRDASRYFGEQLIKYVLEDLFKEGSPVIERATIVREGNITDGYKYLREYTI